MKHKLVSVIVPAYNVEKYITETIDSVIGQTYTNLEIIIVNDGSSDSTPEILNLYAKRDKRINIIQQENKGLSGARNAGLQAATGEYLCIFDADDIMVPSKIEQQVNFLEMNHDIDIVYSNLTHFFDGKETEYVLSMKKVSRSPYRELLEGNFINPNTILMRKDVFLTCGKFDESLRSAEDWDYFLRVARNNFLFGFDNQYLTRYRMRKTSLSSDFSTMYETAIKVLEKQKEYCKKNKLLEWVSVIDQGIERRKPMLTLSYIMKKDYHIARNVDIQTNFFLKITLSLVSLLPKKLIQILFILFKKIKFYKNATKFIEYEKSKSSHFYNPPNL